MQRTQAQQQASRANGAKSTGPATPEGKARSSQNGTRHGLFSTTILLRKESRQAWEQLSADLVARFNPADNVELNLVYEMASATWRSQRCTAMETALLDMEIDVVELTDAPAQSPADEIRVAATAYAKAVGRDQALIELGRQSIRLNNLWMRLYKQLRQLQNDRPEPEPEPAARKSKSEPEVIEITSFQRHADPGPDAAPSADAPSSPAQEEIEPCTGK